MVTVTFHSPAEIPDGALKFAVIAARWRGQWVFCRHRARTTWEIPGGHREPGEAIADTARRELREETGAVDFSLRELAVYGVHGGGEPSYGMLCLADITVLGPLSPDFEIAELQFCDTLPEALTYPAIQPHLFRFVSDALA